MTDRKVLIVGAGCFGISTAYHLLKRGYGDVTIIDRSVVLPAPDAASTDMNKVVRSSYSDIFYSKLAQEAIRAWKNEEDWGTTYHESGVVVLDPPAAVGEGPIESYADMSFDNDVEIGARVRRLEDSTAVRSVFPSSVASSGRLAPLSDATGYLASDGGWAEAAQGVSLMTSRVVALGGRVVPGKTAEGLVREDGATKGVRCTDGSLFYADLVVLAAGSWMASSFPELNLDTKCLATGQSVAMVQLTREEADVYRDCPVVLNFRTGFYIFPPDKHDVVKLSIHAAGHTHMAPHPTAQRLISTPRTILSHADEGLRIPRTVAIELRGHLSHIYPELANKPFIQTRMCWYTDSPDGDWVIGHYQGDPSLVLATAGSGHAYKFLPVIGRLVADIIQGTSDRATVDRFSLERHHDYIDLSRSMRIIAQELDVATLCSPQDLLP